MERYKVGFAAGVFDMFHVGHLNLLRNAKSFCEFLIVGVNSDKLVQEYKDKRPVINQEQRIEIVRAIRFVDRAEIMETLDKILAWNKFTFDVVFIGDDWKGSDRWKKTEDELIVIGVEVMYLPYTKHISSSKLRGHYLDKLSDEN